MGTGIHHRGSSLVTGPDDTGDAGEASTTTTITKNSYFFGGGEVITRICRNYKAMRWNRGSNWRFNSKEYIGEMSIFAIVYCVLWRSAIMKITDLSARIPSLYPSYISQLAILGLPVIPLEFLFWPFLDDRQCS